MRTQATEIVFESGGDWPEVTVVVPLHNYAGFIEEALDSVGAQTLRPLGLVVVDDASTDASLEVVRGWMRREAGAFARAVLARNVRNAGLSITRNTGVSLAASDFVFFLDADNALYPRCLERHREALEGSDATFAYGLLEVFGADTGIMGTEVFGRERLKKGNYVDAMAMIRRSVLVAQGGYEPIDTAGRTTTSGCGSARRGSPASRCRILGRYRVHRTPCCAR